MPGAAKAHWATQTEGCHGVRVLDYVALQTARPWPQKQENETNEAAPIHAWGGWVKTIWACQVAGQCSDIAAATPACV